ncbi:TPA: hypothetical protein HA270_00940, partial [Candidatus Woesearchaeota archaeon]|nr:hypothetical protein [Candidatus Woesearchaeota archaeon]
MLWHVKEGFRLWLYIVLLASFIIIGSVGVHEMGHALAGAMLGCDVQAVFLYSQAENPYASVSCSADISLFMVSIAGMAANVIFALFFLLSERLFMRFIAYMFFGFGLFGSKMDLQSIGMHPLLASCISIAGLAIILYALFKICELEANAVFTLKCPSAK